VRCEGSRTPDAHWEPNEDNTEGITVLLATEHALNSKGSYENFEREDDSDVVGRSDEGEQAAFLATELQPEVTHMDTAIPRLSGIRATWQRKAIHPATAVHIQGGYDIRLSILLPRVSPRLPDARPLEIISVFAIFGPTCWLVAMQDMGQVREAS
jgi:hypothetical protein